MKTVLPFLAVAAVLAATLLLTGPAVRADEEALTVNIVVSPSTLYLNSHGVWVTVHAEIAYSLVDGASVTLDGIPVKVTKSDSRGELVAKFELDTVKAIVPTGDVELTLTGTTDDGETFEGTDVIRVIDGGRK